MASEASVPSPSSAAAAVAMTSARAFGNVPLLSVEDAEKALQLARRETEKLEKSLGQVIKKNRRLLLPALVGSGGGVGVGGGN